MGGPAAATGAPGSAACAVADEAPTAAPCGGRSISAPRARFRRLVRAAPAGRGGRPLSGDGDAVRRPDPGGDGGALPAGCRPAGSWESFRRRIEAKRAGRLPGTPPPFPERGAGRAARGA